MLYRFAVAILWLAFFACTAWAQDLKITGQNVRVVTVIDGAPFQVEAPKGGFGYAWAFPPSITATKKANILEVTAAPKGTVTVSVEYYVVDFDKRMIESRAASITFVVGEPGPGPKPVPPDDGKLGLIKASRDGAAKVISANKAIEAKALAQNNRALASTIAAGAYSEAAKILDAWRAGNNAAAPKEAWAAWGADVSAVVESLYKANKLPTISEWADAFNEIAKGLE